MITSISLNPSIDRTVALDGLNVGGLNRVASQVDVAAGKGVNVALAVAALGGASECIGYMYEKDAELFEDRLDANGVGHDFITLPGSVRVNMKLFDRKAGVITELNAKGLPVEADALARFRAAAKHWAERSAFMILSGSLPPACPGDFYGTIIDDIRGSGCRAILDADGDQLKAGLAAKPFLIKPNISELEGLCGRRLETIDDIVDAANGCIQAGCTLVAVSLGADGALITDGRQALRAEGLKIDVRSTVAAGDSMVAGLTVALDRGDSLEDAFRLGVAAATARCATAPEEAITAAVVADYAAQLAIRTL